MKNIATILTHTGLVAFTVRQHGPNSFSYIGKYGAGSTSKLSDVVRAIKGTHRKGMTVKECTPEFHAAYTA